jgi:hypothetical protein
MRASLTFPVKELPEINAATLEHPAGICDVPHWLEMRL